MSDSHSPVKGNSILIVVHVTKINIHIFLQNTQMTTHLSASMMQKTWSVKYTRIIHYALKPAKHLVIQRMCQKTGPYLKVH